MIALNRSVDWRPAERLHGRFIEVLIAPGLRPRSAGALPKEGVRILEGPTARPRAPRAGPQGVRGGLLVQTGTASRSAGRCRWPRTPPTEEQWDVCWFAWRVVGRSARTRSCSPGRRARRRRRGANEPGRLGTDRDERPARPATRRSSWRLGGRLGRVLPLPDGPEPRRCRRHRAIQPGGSRRDDEVIPPATNTAWP